MTDADFLLEVLSDGRWHGQNEILGRSYNVRGCGLTVHSRASELRTKRGLTIEQENRRSHRPGRVASFYRLVPLVEVTPIGAPTPRVASTSGLATPVKASLDGRSDAEAEPLPPLQLALDVPRQEQEVGGRRAARVKDIAA